MRKLQTHALIPFVLASLIVSAPAEAKKRGRAVLQDVEREHHGKKRKKVHQDGKDADGKGKTKNQQSRDDLDSEKKGAGNNRSLANHSKGAADAQTQRLSGETDDQYMKRMYDQFNRPSDHWCSRYSARLMAGMNQNPGMIEGAAPVLNKYMQDTDVNHPDSNGGYFKPVSADELQTGDWGYAPHQHGGGGHVFGVVDLGGGQFGQVSDFSKASLPNTNSGYYQQPHYMRYVRP